MEQIDSIFRLFQMDKFDMKLMVPSVNMNINANVTDLLAYRKHLNSIEGNPHVTFTHMVMKAVADSLRAYPLMFSFYNGRDIVPNKDVIINVPVEVGNHVEYIIIRKADEKSLFDIVRESDAQLKDIREGRGEFALFLISIAERLGGARAMDFAKYINQDMVKFVMRMGRRINRNMKLKLANDHYGNFPISNFGSFHVAGGALSIAQPVVGGIAICEITKVLKKIDSEIVERDIMPVSLSFDHRVMDGAYAGHFLNAVKKILENPADLLK